MLTRSPVLTCYSPSFLYKTPLSTSGVFRPSIGDYTEIAVSYLSFFGFLTSRPGLPLPFAIQNILSSYKHWFKN